MLPDFLGDATQQEQEVVLLRADGMTYLEIGAALGLPPERVKIVIRNTARTARTILQFEAARASKARAN